MRFIIIHKTSPHWESGASPTPEFVGRVGALMGEFARAGVLESGEGLRASSEGVRVTFSGGTRTVQKGPFDGGNELPAGFSILRTASIDAAIEWATKQADILGDGEVDIRPVTEAWDIGITPTPAQITTRRYMVLRKATPATESGVAPAPVQQQRFSEFLAETMRSGMHLATEKIAPSRRGRRLMNSQNGKVTMDGPFIESKELIAGYVILSAASLDDAFRWAERYFDVVEAEEVDVYQLSDL